MYLGEKMSKITVMAHLVAGYPSAEICLSAAQGLAEGGVSYFEIQFPFSDPSADGKSIQTACAEVLSHGYSLIEGFAFVTKLRNEYPHIPVFIMTYANLAYKTGIAEFVKRAAETGAAGLIIPDLPFDSDEGLNDCCIEKGLFSVPVAAPSMTEERIKALISLNRPFVYAALRAGITGSSTIIDAATLKFVHSLSSETSQQKCKILGGFGIRSGEQASALAKAVHAVVAGSVFVDIISEHYPEGGETVRKAVREKATELSENY